jgi:hypothetical protein
MLTHAFEIHVPPEALAELLERLYPDLAREEWAIDRVAMPLSGHLCLSVLTKRREPAVQPKVDVFTGEVMA